MTATPQQLTPQTASTQPFDLPGTPGFTPPPSAVEAAGEPNMVAPGQEQLLEDFLKEQGLQIQQQQPPEPQPQGERPSWLPEKFKTPEDMARSYRELERRLGQRAQQAAQKAPVAYTRELGVEEFGEALADRFEDAEFNPLELEGQISSGQLSLEDAAQKLAEAGGISRKAAEAMLRSRVEVEPSWSEEQTAEVMQLVGGPEQFQALADWARNTFSDQELAAYNQAVQQGDRAGIELGLKWLVAEAQLRNSQRQGSDLVEPELAVGGPPASGAIFQNGAQVREAMNRLNSRGQRLYDVDESYRRKVEEMIARSPNL